MLRLTLLTVVVLGCETPPTDDGPIDGGVAVDAAADLGGDAADEGICDRAPRVVELRDCGCTVPSAACPTVDEAVRRARGTIICLGEGDHAGPITLVGDARLRGAGPGLTRIVVAADAGCDLGRPAALTATTAVEVLVEGLSVVGAGPGTPCRVGVDAPTVTGAITLRDVEIAGFELAAQVVGPERDAQPAVVLERVWIHDCGQPSPDGRLPDLGEKDGNGGLLARPVESLRVLDSRIEHNAVGDAIFAQVLGLTEIRGSCVRENFAGVSLTGGAAHEVSGSIIDAHVGQLADRQTEEAVSTIALQAAAGDVRVTDTRLHGNITGLVTFGGSLTAIGLDVDAADLPDSSGVVAICGDLDVRGSRVVGTTELGLAGLGSRPSLGCPGATPRAFIADTVINPSRGVAIGAGSIDGLIVMVGLGLDAEIGVLNVGARLLLAGGSQIEAGRTLQLERFDGIDPVDGFGFEVAVGDSPEVVDSLDAGRFNLAEGEAAIRACDADCVRALVAELGFEGAPPGPGLAGDQLPREVEAEASAAAALAPRIAGARP